MKNYRVLVCAYNRPELLQAILQRLKNVGMSDVVVSVDGPKDASGHAKFDRVLQVSNSFCPEVVSEIWVSEENKGCAIAVHSSITRFLAENGAGIILEDDTLPSYQFFPFANEMLQKYQEDQRIGMISGNNHSSHDELESSYIFTRNKATWGWATWDRSWKDFDLSNPHVSQDTQLDILQNMGWSRELTVEHWSRAFNLVETGQVNTWDWQWYRHLANQNQLTITPAVNLVANIGFGSDATHTLGAGKPIYKEIGILDFPLRHPKTFAPSSRFEIYFEATKYFFAANSRSSQQQTSQRSHPESVFARLIDKLPRRVVEQARRILEKFRLLRVIEKLIYGQ